MQAEGEHASSTQKGPCWDLNQEPSCCEETILTATLPLEDNYGNTCSASSCYTTCGDMFSTCDHIYPLVITCRKHEIHAFSVRKALQLDIAHLCTTNY